MEPIIFKNLSNEHCKEDNIKEFIKKIPKDSVFYDLGANLGWFSLYAAAIGLKTYSFELDENNFRGLEENLHWNKNLQDRVKIFNKGIAGYNGKCKMLYTNEIVGGHHKVLFLENFSGPHDLESFPFYKEIEIVTLDSFIEELKIPWPDFLKIDIDGSEYSFLLGNPKTLEKSKGIIIELYINSEYYTKSCEILEKYGFEMVEKYIIPGEDNLFNFVYTKK